MSRSPLRPLLFVVFVSTVLPAQNLPELLYYRFNEGSGPITANAAVPGAGSTGPTVPAAMAFAPGRFGTGLSGTGVSGVTSYIDTGWPLALGSTSWTLELWLNIAPAASTGTVWYFFGESTSGFRSFTNGAAGVNNVILRGNTLTDTIIPAVWSSQGTWSHLAWTMDTSTTPAVCRGYLNGVQVVSVNQAATPAISSASALKVGNSIAAGLNGVMDEFRLWAHVRTPSEILAAYNAEVLGFDNLSVTTTGGGTGDLSVSFTALDPTATEGFLLISGATTSPVGFGPVFGIFPDLLTWGVLQTSASPGNPLHFLVGFPGIFPDVPFVLPPGVGTVFAGQTWDFVGVTFSTGYIGFQRSGVNRITW